MAHVGKCRRCGTDFRGRRDKIYCSERCRYLDWADREPESLPCYYCGMPADTTDHIPPQVVRPKLIELRLQSRYPFVEVYACRECNTLLSDRTLWTPATRKAFIKRALKRRYARYLRVADWTDAEISHLGPTLQRTVITGTAMKNMIRSRLEW